MDSRQTISIRYRRSVTLRTNVRSVHRWKLQTQAVFLPLIVWVYLHLLVHNGHQKKNYSL